MSGTAAARLVREGLARAAMKKPPDNALTLGRFFFLRSLFSVFCSLFAVRSRSAECHELRGLYLHLGARRQHRIDVS